MLGGWFAASVAWAQSPAPTPTPDAAAAEEKVGVVDMAPKWDDVFRTIQGIWRYRLHLGGKAIELNQLLIATIVLILGLYLSRRGTRMLRNRLLATGRLDANRAAVVERLAFYVLFVLVVLFSLQVVQIPLTIFAFFGGAVAIGLGFGAQNIFNNFISGLILMFEQPVRIGDLIEVEDHLGQVALIGARCTRIRRVDGIEMLVPNSKLLENTVVNRTLSDRLIRTSLQVGVAYGSPTRQVGEIIEKAADEHPEVLKAPPPVVLFTDFGDNALLFEVYFWADVRTMMQLRKIASDLRYAIDDAFRRGDITIAFPQRDVHLDSLSPVDIRILDARAESAEEANK